MLGSQENWPILVSLTAVPAVIQAILLLFLPESPRFLILDKKDDEAGKKALMKLRATDDIDEEMDEIKAEGNSSANDSGSSLSVWQLLQSPNLRLALFVTICMHLSQQLSGITAIFYYSTKFFQVSLKKKKSGKKSKITNSILQSAGISCGNSQYATMGVGAIMVTMTIVTIPLMDKLGRRTLHFVGVIGMIICSILITIALNISDLESVDCTAINTPTAETGAEGAGVFAIVATLAFVVFFAFGPGSIPWLITGELFTQAPRSAAIAVATFVNWTGNLAVGLIFPQMQAGITDFSFLPFTIILVILFGILYFYLPETRGIPVNEIEALFQTPNAWKTAIGRSNEMLLQEIRAKNSNSYGATENVKN